MSEKIRGLAPDAPLDSWDLLFNPANAKRIAGCGITMMDSAIDVIPSVLKYLGRDPDSNALADLAAVEQALMAIRPYIRAPSPAAARWRRWRPDKPASRSITPAMSRRRRRARRRRSEACR